MLACHRNSTVLRTRASTRRQARPVRPDCTERRRRKRTEGRRPDCQADHAARYDLIFREGVSIVMKRWSIVALSAASWLITVPAPSQWPNYPTPGLPRTADK